MSLYRFLYRHLLTRLDAELAHDLTLGGLRIAGSISPIRWALQKMFTPTIQAMPIQTLGLQFPHPLGLAAGLDKNATCLPALSALGFSFIEVGTVTPRPQPGNPRQRIFRLTEDEALINRLGFPSAGMETVARNLARLRERPCPIGISLGKNKETLLLEAHQDYAAVLQSLYPYGDFFVVNVSSPNTPELRNLQTREYLATMLAHLRKTMDTLSRDHVGSTPRPMLVKIAPDLSWGEIDSVIELVMVYKFDGIIATNTTVERPGLRSPRAREAGGLSGRPLKAKSNEILRYISKQTHGALCIIGVGGIFSGEDVREKLEAGATLVQAYTGLIYEGPTFVKKAAVHASVEQST